MRIGILGGGGISDTHARAARAIDGVEVVAVHGKNKDKVAALAQSAGAVAYYDLDGFLAHPMDIVAIGSPSGVHAEQAIAWTKAAPSGMRAPGSFTSARVMSVRTPGGSLPGSGSGSCRTCLRAMVTALSPSKAGWPVRH